MAARTHRSDGAFAETQVGESDLSNASDAAELHGMGYKQELKRSFGLFGMIGFAFSVLTCWTALAGSLVFGINAGGPPVIIYSWIFVCVFSLAVAYSFAEITSAFPTAGGQYAWTHCLSPPKHARITSYICGWFIVIGFLSAGAANSCFGAQFVLGLAQMAHPDYTVERWHIVLLAYLCLGLASAVNIWGRSWLEKMSKVMITFNLVAFIIVIVAVLARDKQKQPASFVFKDFQNFTGFGDAYASLLGILQAAFGMTGYDAAAHLSEEMKNARKDVPKAIVASVYVGAVTGFIFLISLCFCIVDIDAVATTPTGVPLIAIFQQATGSNGLAGFLTGCVTVISLISLCFLSTQSSRVIFAFARDGGLPFSGTISKVDPKRHTPTNAILLVLFVNVALLAIYFGSVEGFNTVVAISTEGFYLSYIMPLLVRVWGRYTGREIDSGFSLGRAGWFLNLVGIFYLAFALITFNFPSSYPVTSSTMNYTCAATGASAAIAIATWYTTGRRNYTGPLAARIIDKHHAAEGQPKLPEDTSIVEVRSKGDTGR